MLRSERGFTLLELMIVTLVLGILAMIASGAVGRIRERAMVAATTAELRQATAAIERYTLIFEGLPASLGDLESVDYRQSSDINYCRFEYVEAGGGTESHVALEAAHRASETVVATLYPVWGNRMDEVKRKGGCPGGGGGTRKDGGGNRGGGGGGKSSSRKT